MVRGNAYQWSALHQVNVRHSLLVYPGFCHCPSSPALPHTSSFFGRTMADVLSLCCNLNLIFPRKILFPVQVTEVSHFTTRLTLNLQPPSTSLKWVHELDHWYNFSSQFAILGLPVTWIMQSGAISCYFQQQPCFAAKFQFSVVYVTDFFISMVQTVDNDLSFKILVESLRHLCTGRTFLKPEAPSIFHVLCSSALVHF